MLKSTSIQMSRKQHTAAADIGTSEFCPTEREHKTETLHISRVRFHALARGTDAGSRVGE